MLLLSRKVGEKLVVDDEITIVVNRVSRNRVSIGIEAPEDVQITRPEASMVGDTRGGEGDPPGEV